jgi:hypothetical protein
MADAAPATFNLTEEEKAILRSTLRVVALEPDRIELAVKEPPQVRRLQLSFVLIGAVAFALVCIFDDSLSLTVSFVNALPLIGLAFLWAAIGTRPIRNILLRRTIAFFPDTAWSICRRQGRGGWPHKKMIFGLLVRVDPVKSDADGKTEFDTSLRIRTDLGVLTIKRRRFEKTPTARCREILSRVVGDCTKFPEPSPIVAALAHKEGAFHAMLWRCQGQDSDYPPPQPPTEFDLTEEDKAVLRRTLHVITLEPDRIEFAVKHGWARIDPQRALLSVAAPMVAFMFAGARSSGGVPFAHLMPLFCTLLVIAIFFNWIVFSRYVYKPLRSVCLFAGSAWVVCRGHQIPSYEKMIKPDPGQIRFREKRLDRRPHICTDVRVLALKRQRANECDVKTCRKILDRIVDQCIPFQNPSPTVVSLGAADSVPWDLPREQYAILIDHPWLVTLSPDELVMRLSPSQRTVALLQAFGVLVAIGIFGWLGLLDRTIDYSTSVWPWPQFPFATIFIVSSPFPLLLISPQTIHIRRRDRLVAIAEKDRGEKQFPAEDYDASYTQIFIQREGSTFMTQSFSLYYKPRLRQAKRSRRKKIATWWLEDSDPALEPPARHASDALRYYLNQSPLDEIASPTQQRPRS